MTLVEGAGERKIDFSILSQMVGVQKSLKALVYRQVPLDKEVVLGVLKEQQEAYSSEGMFEKKTQLLLDIITSLEQGSVQVDDVLKAAGIDAAKLHKASQGFSIRRLWDRIWSK